MGVGVPRISRVGMSGSMGSMYASDDDVRAAPSGSQYQHAPEPSRSHSYPTQHYPPPPPQQQYVPMYSTYGGSSMHEPPRGQAHTHPGATNELVDLGIASRDSRLDEKWSMFMSDSGILETPGYHRHG